MRNKSPQRAQRSTEEFLRADSYSLWLRNTCFQIHSLEWQIPMRVENLEAPLLLALVGFLIRKQLLLYRVFVKSFISDRGVLENDRYSIIPAPVFSSVVARLIHPDLEHTAHLNFFF